MSWTSLTASGPVFYGCSLLIDGIVDYLPATISSIMCRLGTNEPQSDPTANLERKRGALDGRKSGQQ